MSYPHPFARAALAALVVSLASCGGGGGGSAPAPGPGGPPPEPLTLRSSAPADRATGVDRGVRPELTLSQAVAADAVTLSCAGQSVPAQVTAGTTVQVTPGTRLPPLAPCTVQVAGGPSLTFTTADAAWAAEAQQLESNPGASAVPSIAIDPQGNAIAVWMHELPGGGPEIWTSRAAAGGGWDAPRRLDEGVAPQVVVDAQGNAIAAWLGADETRTAVVAARFTPAGGWGPVEILDGDESTPSLNVRLAINAQGDAIATWRQEQDGSFAYNIRASRYVPGTGWQGAQRIEQLAQPVSEPRPAMAPDGTAMVAWGQSNGDTFHVTAATSGRSGGWSAPVTLDAANGSAGDAAVAASADGSFMAIWTQPGAFIEVWARRFRPGTGWEAAARVDAAPNGTLRPTVAMDASGRAIALWVQNGASDLDVWSARHVPGSGWSAPQAVENLPRDADGPQVAIDAAGNAIAVWHQRETGGSTAWSARLPAGGSWGSVRRLGSSGNADIDFPVLALGANGGGIAAWTQDDGEIRVFFNRFD